MLDDEQLGDILNVDELEDSIGIQNMYINYDNFANKSPRSGESFILRNTYDDTIFLAEGEGINPDDLPPRPISQMDYDEIIAYHLRK